MVHSSMSLQTVQHAAVTKSKIKGYSVAYQEYMKYGEFRTVQNLILVVNTVGKVM